ncbi:MAG: N-acetyl-gamma-glutamyl-phosphate reductase [Bacteroidales bacterium]|nr:N-acetyl-gamma-glutamyl-phosphate reductase [Bacteroidales bacterium]
MYKIGIIGGAGYTAGELLRLLVNHPAAEVAFVHSESHAGEPVALTHEGLWGDTDLVFSADAPLEQADVLFLCGAHGKSAQFWEANKMPEGLKVIDLAQDYRDQSEGYVYGLPEWQKAKIQGATKIANPGCFATAIQLALLPLAAKGLLKEAVNVTAITGSTGAGVKPGATTHFSWRNNNLSAYKVFEHQHLLEICRNLESLQGAKPTINFVPVRGDFARGIFATLHTPCELGQQEAEELYKNYYKDAPFTFLFPGQVDLKQVVNTNKCLISLEKHDGELVITSVIDNLLKGAAGQAVQNMNLMLGLEETTGLKLKASAF